MGYIPSSLDGLFHGKSIYKWSYIGLIYGRYLLFRFLKWPVNPHDKTETSKWNDPLG